MLIGIGNLYKQNSDAIALRTDPRTDRQTKWIIKNSFATKTRSKRWRKLFFGLWRFFILFFGAFWDLSIQEDILPLTFPLVKTVLRNMGGDIGLLIAPKYPKLYKKTLGTFILGILRDKILEVELMWIDDDKLNYPFCRLKLVVETFKHST